MSNLKKWGMWMLIFSLLASMTFPTQSNAALAPKKVLVYYAGKKLTYKNYYKVTTSNAGVVSVTKKGKSHIVKMKKTGTATIKIYKKVKKTVKKVATRYICVLSSKSSVSYNNDNLESNKVVDIKFPKGCSVSFSTKDSDVAQMTQQGNILPVSNGKTNLYTKVTYKGKGVRKYTETVQIQDGSIIPIKTTTTDYIKQSTEVLYANPNQVIDPTLKRIEVIVNDNSVYINQPFSKDNIVVTAYYSDGSKKQVYDFTMSYTPKTVAGRYMVTVSYGGQTTFFYVNVKTQDVKLQSLQCELLKSSLLVNEALTKNDMIVTAKYTDGSSQIIRNYAMNFSAKQVAGTYPVVITYQGMSYTFNINVIDNYSKALQVDYTGGELAPGQMIDKSKIKVTLVMADGTMKQISDFGLEYMPKVVSGTYPVKITYGSFTNFFHVTVKGNVTALELKVSYSGGELYVGETVKRENLVVRQLLSNGSELVVTDYNMDFTPQKKSGTYYCTIYYDGLSIKFPVTVIERPAAAIESLVAAYHGNVTVGMNLDVDKLSVVVHFADGTTRALSYKDYALTYTVLEKPGTCLVTIEYGGCKTVLNVNYVEASVVSLNAELNKVSMYVGQAFDKTFIGTVTATMSNNKIVTPAKEEYSLALYKGDKQVVNNIPSEAGTYTAKLIYKGFVATYTITVLEH